VLGAIDFTAIEVWTKSGLDNRLIEGGEEIGRVSGGIQCRKRLGALLRYSSRLWERTFG
jgi:hypothetical protein